jgi:hypothetical protein
MTKSHYDEDPCVLHATNSAHFICNYWKIFKSVNIYFRALDTSRAHQSETICNGDLIIIQFNSFRKVFANSKEPVTGKYRVAQKNIFFNNGSTDLNEIPN